MNDSALLAVFDEQMRQNASGDGTGAIVERVGRVVRYVSPAPTDGSTIVWSDLDEASADGAIDEQMRYFAGRGQAFEWKHYAHDRPVDLPARLRAAGFERGDDEAVMVAEVARLDRGVALPPDLRLVRVRDAAGVDLVVRAHEGAFGVDHTWLRHALLAQLESAPDAMAAFVVLAGEAPVCSGRVEFRPGTDFASLWGGGTLPAYRGRGVYRALVAERARLAAERGVRYLQVDALPPSRPILERLGFRVLTTTTPYLAAIRLPCQP